MPRTAIDYSKTVIYKIVCNDLTVTDCYVGNTTDFTKRKCKHKSVCLTSDRKVYTFIRNNQGWENWSMLEIEKYPCNDNNEARLRERYWYEELNAQLNMKNPNRSQKECDALYYRNNVEQIAITDKIYREAHKPEIAAKNKIWRDENKDEIKIKKQVYYQLNADAIIAKKAERIQCGCGKLHNQGDKSKHIRTQFHQKYLLTQTTL